MPMLADQVDAVISVDTHHDTHTASVVTPLGAELAHLQVPADAAGYETLLDFARTHAPGPRIVWALEGTRSHGTGLTRALQAGGQRVVEVDRPEAPRPQARQERPHRRHPRRPRRPHPGAAR